MVRAVKLVFFGAQESGKTEIANCFKDPAPSFSEKYIPTIGVDFFNKTYSRQDSNPKEDYKLNCWDTGGDIRFKSITEAYYNNAEIGIYCVDLSKPLDNNKISADITSFKEQAVDKASVIVVGTKSDHPGANLKAFEALQAQDNDSFYFVVSAKNKDGLDGLSAKVKDLSRQHAFEKSNSNIALPSISSIDKALESSKGSALYNAIENLKKEMASLPANKYEAVGNETWELVQNLKCPYSEPNEFIKTFETNCYAHLKSEHPVYLAVAKAVAIVAIAAVVTVIAALTGFGIGFAAGAWIGPAAFISGVAGASAAVGLIAGVLAGYGFFKASPIEKAVHEVAQSARNTSPFDF